MVTQKQEPDFRKKSITPQSEQERMSTNNRRKLHITTFVSGILSISSYILLYTHQEWVTRNFTRGGIYALLPIVTAFYFSFIHGTFTSCLLHTFGLRVATKKIGNPVPTGDDSKAEVSS